MKRILTFSISLLLLFSIFSSFNILTIYADESKEDWSCAIYDNANILDEQEEANLKTIIESCCYKKYNITVAILTDSKDYPTDSEIQKMTDDFYDENIGKTDGILFYISEYQIYINTVGYPIIAINDSEIDDMIDKCWDDFLAYDYEGVLSSLITNSSNYINEAYINGYTDDMIDEYWDDFLAYGYEGVLNSLIANSSDYMNKAHNKGYTDDRIETNVSPPLSVPQRILVALIPSFASIIITVMACLVVYFILNRKHKSASITKGQGEALHYKFSVNSRNQKFLYTTHHTRAGYYSSKIGRSGSSHSSGSFHSSSSGTSHGGGGRRR